MSGFVAPSDELAYLTSQSVVPLERVLTAYVRALLEEDWIERRVAFEAVQDALGRLTAFANLLGRRRMNMLWRAAAARAPREERVALAAASAWTLAATPRQPLLPVVEFQQATSDILTREPEIAPGYEAVQALYREQHAFALAKSTSLAVTRRVQKLLAEEMRGGTWASRKTADRIQELGPWTKEYADTVFATNVRTAYTAGQWARVADPAVREVLPAMLFRSALMVTSRPNHTACHGLIAPIDSTLWESYSPPLGYNCHCAIDELSVYDLERRNLIGRDGKPLTVQPPGFAAGRAHPDPGFGGGRPDRRIAFG